MNKVSKVIGILSDVHGNYYALEQLLGFFDSIGCQQIINCGDIVNMGHQSLQCVQRLLGKDNIINIIGNHDYDYAWDNAVFFPYSHTAAQHKRYVFDSIGDKYRQIFRDLPLTYSFRHGDKVFAFVHYALQEGESVYRYQPVVEEPTVADFDRMFDKLKCDVVFFGHKHEPIDLYGNKTYINVGSVGCHRAPLARGIVLYIYDNGKYEFLRVAVPYNRQQLYQEMTSGDLPDGKYIFDYYFDRTTRP